MKYDRNQFDAPLDTGIERAVIILNHYGIEIDQSCQGGKGHSCPEPAVLFHGSHAAGLRAVSIALEYRMPVKSLRRVWDIDVMDNDIEGPHNELVFSEYVPLSDEEINGDALDHLT